MARLFLGRQCLLALCPLLLIASVHQQLSADAQAVPKQQQQQPNAAVQAVQDEPGKPGRPQITEVDSDFVSLKWDIPMEDGGTKIVNYLVEMRMPGNEKWKQVANSERPFATVKGLDEGTEYEFRVKAVNSVGPGQASEHEEVTTWVHVEDNEYFDDEEETDDERRERARKGKPMNEPITNWLWRLAPVGVLFGVLLYLILSTKYPALRAHKPRRRSAGAEQTDQSAKDQQQQQGLKIKKILKPSNNEADNAAVQMAAATQKNATTSTKQEEPLPQEKEGLIFIPSHRATGC